MQPTLTLTQEELTASLILTGYEGVAEDLIALFNLSSESEAERFIYGTEATLSAKGYLNAERPNGLEEGLEQLIHLLVQSKRKIRWIQGSKVRFIHQIAKKKLLVQEIENGQHTFSFYETSGIISSVLQRWYTPKRQNSSENFEFVNIEMTVQEFDDLHQMSNEFVAEITNNTSISPVFRTFIIDMFDNGNEFDNISFLYSDFTNDEMKMNKVAFFLPSTECIWYLNYDLVEEDTIIVGPTEVNIFFETLENDIKEFLSISTSL